MLIGKAVKVVKSEDKKSYTARLFDRVYLQFGETDKLVDADSNTDGKPTVDATGATMKLSVPEKDVTVETDVDKLVGPALAFCETYSQKFSEYKKADGTPIDNCGWLFLLRAASDSIDLIERALLDKEMRPKAAVDPAKAKAAQIKAIIADRLARGKQTTPEQAEKIYQAQLAAENDL